MEVDNNLTAERSLEIIRESIERSQRTIHKNSALPLIWWGGCVVVFSLFIAYLYGRIMVGQCGICFGPYYG